MFIMIHEEITYMIIHSPMNSLEKVYLIFKYFGLSSYLIIVDFKLNIAVKYICVYVQSFKIYWKFVYDLVHCLPLWIFHIQLNCIADLKKKKKVQCKSCEWSFIWGKMRIAARKTALQIALRNSSEEAVGRSL